MSDFIVTICPHGVDQTVRLCALCGYLDALFAQSARIAELEKERDKLAVFKKFVHDRLDKGQVPTDPPGEHRDAGCRIGQRLDWLFDRIAQLEAYEMGSKPEDQFRQRAQHLLMDTPSAARPGQTHLEGLCDEVENLRKRVDHWKDRLYRVSAIVRATAEILDPECPDLGAYVDEHCSLVESVQKVKSQLDAERAAHARLRHSVELLRASMQGAVSPDVRAQLMTAAVEQVDAALSSPAPQADEATRTEGPKPPPNLVVAENTERPETKRSPELVEIIFLKMRVLLMADQIEIENHLTYGTAGQFWTATPTGRKTIKVSGTVLHLTEGPGAH